MTTHILNEVFHPYQWLSEFAENMPAGRDGAAASFIGTMRDFNDDASVTKMTLEHYPAMTTNYLNKLERQAREKWPLTDCLIVHRVGDIEIGQAIVLIGCWSAHRRAALDACAWLIETLKYNAPFWKKETRADGEHWVQCNTDGTET